MKRLNNLESYWMPFTANRDFKKDPRMVVAADGMYYKSETGQDILDSAAGLWCVNAGHCRSRIVNAVKAQVEKMDYGLSFQMGHKLAFEFAEKLVNILPNEINHTFFLILGLKQ